MRAYGTTLRRSLKNSPAIWPSAEIASVMMGGRYRSSVGMSGRPRAKW